MNDRLADLKGMGGAGDGAGDLEAGGGGAQSAFMASFFDEVNEVKKVMATIRHNVKLVEQNHGECLIAISGEQTKESRARLEQLMKETNDCAQKVRSRLKGMDQENKDFAKRNEGSSEAACLSDPREHGREPRRRASCAHVPRPFFARGRWPSYPGDTDQVQEQVPRPRRAPVPDRQAERRAVRDRAGARRPGGADTRVGEHLRQPAQPQRRRYAAARNALADIQERHQDIKRLEASISSHQLFLDMSVLVETQGELLDQIEYTVGQSVNYTGKAVEELRTAGKYQRKVRKKMCCVIIVLLVILIIFLSSFFAASAGQGGDNLRLRLLR